MLRLLGIDKYPAGFTPDEASFGYDAYSILKTGKEQWGESFPLAFRSFGDFKAPIYTYLAIPSVAIFGLNEFAVRLPNAALGTLAVLITYFMVAAILKRGNTQNKTWNYAENVALMASLLLAISPWHISLSRGAFEANLTTFLMPLSIYAFLRGLENKRWMIISSFAFGLNLFSYHSAKLITPILVVIIVWLSKKNLTPLHKQSLTTYNSVTRYALALVIFVFFVTVSGYILFLGAGARGGDIGIFNPTGGWGAVADRRYEALQIGLPDFLSRLFSNKVVYTGSEFTKNYLSYFSPTFLFTQGAGEATYGMIPGHGVLYLFELPFIVMAIFYTIKRPVPGILFVIAWILLSPIPSALTKGPGFAANRVAVMMPAIHILSAFGAVTLYGWWKRLTIRPKPYAIRKIGLLGYWIFGLLGFLFFLEAYFYHAPRSNAPSMSYGWKEAMGSIQSIEEDYDNIIISRAFSEPHIFIAFHKKWDPQDYQKQAQDWLRYEKQRLLFVDQLGEWHLGKYTFRDIKYQEDSNIPGVLLVGREKDFPRDVIVLHRVNYPDAKTAILVVESNGN